MVNNISVPTRPAASPTTSLTPVARLVDLYVVLVVATLVVLGVLSSTDPGQATSSAWVHAIIVAAVGLLLPLRLRAARRGSADGLRAVGIIAGVLLVVNVVEAVLPGAFPDWMRVEMGFFAVLMAAVVALVALVARAARVARR